MVNQDKQAVIIRSSKSAMTSGLSKTKAWSLLMLPDHDKEIDPLMGWTGSSSTIHQVKINFENLKDAEAYAKSNGIQYTVQDNHSRKPNIRKMGYGENFSYNRKTPWTH